MSDSDDESSDSSNDFTGITPKDELTASFFTIKPAVKANLVNSKEHCSEDESSDDDNFTNVPETNNIELFNEVVKNLEASQKACINDEESKQQSSKQKAIKTVNISDEINAVLLQGEKGIHTLCKSDEGTDEEEEKVEDVKRPDDYTIPKEGIQINLPGTSMIFKKKTSKKELDLAALLRRKLKANQIIIEKAARLCWLAHGFYLNHQANDPEIMSTVVSLVSQNNYPKNNFDLAYLSKFTKWFRNMFTIEPSDNEMVANKETLLKRIAEKKVFNYRELVILYVATLRAIGLQCRLVLSLNPPLVKSYNELLSKTNIAKKNDKVKKEPKESKAKTKSSKEEKNADSKKNIKSENVIKNSESARRNANEEAKKKAAEILRSKYCYNKKNKDKVNNIVSIQDKASTSKDVKAVSTSLKKESIDRSPRRLRSYKTHVASTANKQDNTQTNSKNNQCKTQGSKRRLRSSSSSSSGFDSEEEEDEEEKLFRKPKGKHNNNKVVTKSNEKDKKKNQASEDEGDADNNDKITKRQNVWAEVYVESKGCWICVNVMDANVDCVTEIYKKASKPVLYVIAYNSERFIKDVTRRYCPQWLPVIHKQRIDEKWWNETLKYWHERETAISKQENELLLQKELEQPLPKTITECKGHPLYVLVRHLLKYEALYPPDCVPLGHLKTGEAIYSRYCVHTLRSRETWLKQARVVKPKQDPYKIVKALPKYDKLSGMKLKDSALELFGEWQTTEYEPPEAKDGIVPRNEYGNVDLFKKCMLPKGTVHINLPGLNRIARKLNIDCATAVVGFNFGCRGAVPAIEGYVVCAEYEDTLREAWETEQVEAAKRAIEKRKKRVYGNWKKLIKGLLIREKLSQKYEFQEESKSKPIQSNKRLKQQKGMTKKSKS